MAHRTSQKNRLRPPFLITVATLASAALPGCGGAVTTEDPGGAGGSSGSSGMTAGTAGTSSVATGTTDTTGTVGTGTTGTSGTSGAGGGPIADCPATQPAGGSSCATEGQSCAYPYCGPPTELRFDCRGGLWSMQAVGSCNPPPPQGCPATEPMRGTPCSASPTLSCPFQTGCCGAAWEYNTYFCTTGAWQMIPREASVCIKPPPSCPVRPPSDGNPCCFSAPLATSCYYGCNYAPDGAFGSLSAKCDGIRWHVVANSFCTFPVDASISDVSVADASVAEASPSFEAGSD